MDSGDGSVPKRCRTRQQFMKYFVDFIEKRNRSCQNGGNTPSSSACSVNIGEEKGVSCGRKRKTVEKNIVSKGDKRKMGKWSEDGSVLRNLEKGKKKVDNGRSRFSPGTCESITKQPFVEEISDDDGDDDSSDDSEEEECDPDDVVFIGEEEAVNSSVGLRSPILNAIDEEVVSSTSSMCCRTMGRSEEVFTDSTSSSESESDSEASSDEDNDDPEDKNYRLIESSSSSQSDDVTSDSDVTESEDEKNEERKKESNRGLLPPQLVVEGEKHKKGRAYLLRPRSLSKYKKKKLNNGNYSSSPILLTDGSESDGSEAKSLSEEDCEVDDSVKNVVQKDAVPKDRKTRKKILKDSEFLKFVVDSIINVDDHDKLSPFEEKEEVPVKETLPLVFRFEDEVPFPYEKEEWEKGVEDLFIEMEMCILESHIGFTNPSVSPTLSGNLSDCQMGNHQLVLDEQIGLICKVCSHVHLEIKYIYPSFAQRTRGRYERKYLGESPSLLDVDGFRFSDSSAVQDSLSYEEGTVWNLVHRSAKETMYPHQRGGFEFMWKNVAGDITLERLRQPLGDSKGGCIISHPPGTGKTRLTIVFLQSYLKLFPKSRPVIIAPSNLLLNWEAEFQKWEVDIPFHNLNSKDFLLQEDEATLSVFRCLSHVGKRNPHLIRMVKLRSWAKSASVLGISYDLFRILTGDDGDSYAKQIREILLKLPGLLVLEEGHTARNEQSLVWKALKKVETEKRIVLSGTPFQNNIKELYNTLCVVSPKFAADLEEKWASLSSSIDKNARALEELRDIISPLVHKCSENVKKVSLPGIRDTVIHLKPTDLQKELLRRIPENPGSFYEQNLVSLISVHPSLVAKRKEFSDLESQLKERGCRLDPDTGVKMKFVVELIRLCGGQKERVIIFSQLLDPLNLIKEQLNSLIGWTLGREILYMDGKLDVKQRQISINSLNDPKSDVKVLLASIKACSEGISLIGASRVVLLDVLWNPSVEQQAISRAYRNGQTKFVHVYCPVTSKWEVDKIEQQRRKKYHSDVLLSRNHEVKIDPSCSVSEDSILESMVKHEGLRHIFEKLSHAPRVVLPTTCFNSCSQPSKPSS
ncbi:SNF2 domain-containing protein CLASSY 4-like [Solanum dulcamara]|uniref:SNF2 domain-containing protein CLASSY 4-like n=1 Tax=Solanum dulcamara TaxID=45834 RepID=UPI002485D135|nr:SNF2 domain-containing protein CLASSY 4-like [Solanum dulcamara]XP_055815129.1 SNF2 domain-containing protein CLASSY 4-like [Solanum dulcamara]